MATMTSQAGGFRVVAGSGDVSPHEWTYIKAISVAVGGAGASIRLTSDGDAFFYEGTPVTGALYTFTPYLRAKNLTEAGSVGPGGVTYDILVV